MGTDLKRRIGIFVVVMIAAVAFLGPTISCIGNDSWPKCPKPEGPTFSKPISLGLDLSGGVYLLYEVQVREAVKSRLQSMSTSIRSDLRKEKVALRSAKVSDTHEVEFKFLSANGAEKGRNLISNEYSTLKYRREASEGNYKILVFGIEESHANEIMRTSVDQAVETIRNRVDQKGVAEPLIQKIVGKNRIALQMPGETDIESVKKIVGSVAKLEFRLLPVGEGTESKVLKDRQGVTVRVEDEVRMTGDAVESASVNMFEGQVEVSLNLTTQGGRTFRKITTDNVGRQLAIILDNVVYSSPRINEPIPGGRASISGGFSWKEAQDLSIVLRAGSLPAPLKELESSNVGPSLGEESITRGVSAIFFGFILVVVFMIFYYKKSGLIAVGTLAVNILLVLAGLSALGATLTLPGLAGLALTVGMAVDANVIIFERIREELRAGASRDSAVISGFEKALSAIIDSNLTTLLAGIILYYFGSGPIRGFAVTLSIGILTTIFCATFVSRLAFDYFPLKGKDELSI